MDGALLEWRAVMKTGMFSITGSITFGGIRVRQTPPIQFVTGPIMEGVIFAASARTIPSQDFAKLMFGRSGLILVLDA